MFTMVHKISLVLIIVPFMIDALTREANIFDNEETYLLKKHTISKRSRVGRPPAFSRNHGERYNSMQHRRCYMSEEFDPRVNRCVPRECPNGRWGFTCYRICECENEQPCNRRRGFCICTDGWHGDKCQLPCPDYYYGYHCSQRCRCKNNADCNHISGECNCTAGYQGPLCGEQCPNGTHGYQCMDECKCQNDAVCHHEDGSCECRAGWTGAVCAERCPDGKFGVNCSEICNCHNNATCNFITGECNCTDGFHGENCEIQCLSEEWGISEKCNCTNEECSLTSGSCICFPGFSGTYCQKLDCPANKWGKSCSNECSCKNGGFCHPAFGTCCCKENWTGEDCSIIVKEHSLKQAMKNQGTWPFGIIAGISVSIIVIVCIIAGAMYYKKHSTKEKKDVKSSYLQLKNEDRN